MRRLHPSLVKGGGHVEKRSSKNLRGIDISHWQGNVDFKKVKAAGVTVVYMKASEGTSYTDPKLKTYHAAARAAGLKIGFYHFFIAASEAAAKAEAAHFLAAIKGLSYDCRPMIDVETPNKPSKAQRSSYVRTFIAAVEKATGHQMVIYTYTSFAKSFLDKTLAYRPLWIAQYGAAAPGNNGIWSSWTGFQYSSTGKVAGISGNVDLDEFKSGILLPAVNVGIKTLQHQLNAYLGEKLVEDGIKGPKTAAAIAAASKVLLKQGSKGGAVKLLQARLGSLAVDGVFGPKTLAAVKKYQKAHGLTADGIVGPKTWAKLL
jgi:GH25 family lysozyme M1 (1,4-beta-N-acetylmuramidase)